MLLFIANTAVATLSPPSARAQAQATATIRIERPAIANSAEWDRAPRASRKEVIRRDERGRPVLLRLIEHQ